MGESAGAGSILAHVSAFGGVNGLTPFRKAIIQSPAIAPATDATYYAQLYQQFLTTANVSNYDAARKLSTDQLQGVNQAMVGGTAFASSEFGMNRCRLLYQDTDV
jgi:carboxylesterase type B